MRVVLNASSISSTGMSGIGQYTHALACGLCRCRSTEGLTFIGSREIVQTFISPSHDDRLIDPAPDAQLWEQLELPELLAAEGADLYHNPAFGLPLIKSCRYVTTVHDCIPRIFPDLAPPWLTRLFQEQALTWLTQADHLICASHHTAHDVSHLYGIEPEKLSVVYQAVGEGFAPASSEAVLKVRKLYGLDRPYILVVGRVELRKNIAGIVRAFRLLQNRDLTPHLLVLAGPRDKDVWDSEGVLPPEGRHEDIVVTGFVPEADLAALYSGASVFCFPSFYEGFGRPVLEAMACGAPVVASCTSSVPEVGGEACLYVNPYEAEEIAEGLCRVTSDAGLRDDMRQRGLLRASEFTLERMGTQTLQIYHQLVEGL